MRGWTTVFILFFVLVPTLAWSDIYYWIDDQGIQNYTTRLDSIPEPYRSKTQTLSLPASPPAPPELQPSASPTGVTKISFAPGSPVLVSAKINGAGQIPLILDTGADRTLVKPSALWELGISTEDASPAVLRGVTGTSYGGAVWVNLVEVGEAKVGPLLIVVHDADLKEAQGLLGRDFLSHFHLTIDSKEKLVTLTPN